MKTFAAVICALLATAGVAFAHGSAAGGPVMLGGGSSIRSGLPVFSAVRPASSVTDDNDRRHRKPVTSPNVWPMYVWDPKICRPPQYLLTPEGVLALNGAYPCGLNDGFVPSAYGSAPFWLAPAFMW